MSQNNMELHSDLLKQVSSIFLSLHDITHVIESQGISRNLCIIQVIVVKNDIFKTIK